MKRLILLVLIMVVCCSCVFGCTTVTGNVGNSTSESESLTESEKESVSESEKDSISENESLTESEKESTSESEKDSVSESQPESEEENTPTVSTEPEEVTDEKIIERLVSYDFDIRLPADGSHRSIRHLWDGTSPDIMYEGSFNEKDGYDTFLVEYQPESDDYYFIYLKSRQKNNLNNNC